VDGFVLRKSDAGDASHTQALALSLFMLWSLTNNNHSSFAASELAISTDFFNR